LATRDLGEAPAPLGERLPDIEDLFVEIEDGEFIAGFIRLDLDSHLRP